MTNILDELMELVRRKKQSRQYQDRSKYKPHQNKREKDRRKSGGFYNRTR